MEQAGLSGRNEDGDGRFDVPYEGGRRALGKMHVDCESTRTQTS